MGRHSYEVVLDHDAPVPDGMTMVYDTDIGRWIYAPPDATWEFSEDAMWSGPTNSNDIEQGEQ